MKKNLGDVKWLATDDGSEGSPRRKGAFRKSRGQLAGNRISL